MITNQVKIEIIPDSTTAPNYDNTFRIIKMEKCIIIKNGTINGNSTVDIQLKDIDGNNYLIMSTGFLLECIVAALSGATSKGD